MARVLKGSHSFTCTPTRSIRNRNEPYLPLPSWYSFIRTPEGWKAELAWVAGYIVRQFICPKAVTHPTTNRAQCRATALIETDALPLHQTATVTQHTDNSVNCSFPASCLAFSVQLRRCWLGDRKVIRPVGYLATAISFPDVLLRENFAGLGPSDLD